MILRALKSRTAREILNVDVLPSGELITSSAPDSISVWEPGGKGFR